MDFEVMDDESLVKAEGTLIQVFGVGGGGCNAVNRMIEQDVGGVDFIAANTDVQALSSSKAKTKLPLGSKLTNGLGAGGNPKIGQQSAEEDGEAIRNLIQPAQMIFIAAGMGGGTGTGAAPVIAQIARECGVLSVGVVTLPFDFEGKVKRELAEQGVAQLRKHVDTIITIPNQVLLKIVPDMPLLQAFLKADEILRMGVQGIADLITHSGYINVDFNDVKTIMVNGGTALMGIGHSKGDDRAVKAAQAALTNPLLSGLNIRGAKGVLVQVTGDKDFSLSECDTVMAQVNEHIGGDAVTTISGVNVVPDFDDGLRVTIIATGFGSGRDEQEEQDELVLEQEEAEVEQRHEQRVVPMEPLTSPAQHEDDLLSPAFLRSNYYQRF